MNSLENTSKVNDDEICLFPREYRDLAWVPRWGIARVIRRQSVAEHSYYVALYADILARECGLSDAERMYLVTSALFHDQSECYTGDTPGPVKHATANKEVLAKYESDNDFARFGDTPQCPPYLKSLLKVADLFEETAYLHGEMQQGNKSVVHMAEASLGRLLAKLSETKTAMGWTDEFFVELERKILRSLNEEMNNTSRGVVSAT